MFVKSLSTNAPSPIEFLTANRSYARRRAALGLDRSPLLHFLVRFMARPPLSRSALRHRTEERLRKAIREAAEAGRCADLIVSRLYLQTAEIYSLFDFLTLLRRSDACPSPMIEVAYCGGANPALQRAGQHESDRGRHEVLFSILTVAVRILRLSSSMLSTIIESTWRPLDPLPRKNASGYATCRSTRSTWRLFFAHYLVST